MKKCLPVIAAVLVLACSCSGSDASPTGESNTSVVPQHAVEPTPEMVRAAENQCREDGDLAEGYVRAVDPNSGQTIMEYSVACSEVEN